MKHVSHLVRDPDLYSCRVLFFRRARLAFAHVLRNASSDRRVLLPAYIGLSERDGSGLMDPIVETGVPFSFYRMTRDVRVDIDDLRDQLSRDPVCTVVLVHYFGFSDPQIVDIAHLCQACHAVMIEDCSHCPPDVHHRTEIGTFGQFAIYSVHKFLPTNDGGLLRDNRCLEPLSDPAPQDRMSSETLQILHRADFVAIAAQRTDNYRQLQDQLRDCDEISFVHSHPPSNVVPLNLPLLLPRGTRPAVFQSLLEHGVRPESLYYRLVPEIQSDQFPESHEFANRIINLPIHQEVRTDQIRFIATAFRLALAASSNRTRQEVCT